MNVTMNFSDETMRQKETPMTTIETISWSKRVEKKIIVWKKQKFTLTYFFVKSIHAKTIDFPKYLVIKVTVINIILFSCYLCQNLQLTFITCMFKSPISRKNWFIANFFMNCFKMSFQIRILSKTFITTITFVRFNILMNCCLVSL